MRGRDTLKPTAEHLMASFPTTPDALTTDWLSGALGYPVHGFRVSHFSEGAGVMALVTRLHLQANHGPDSLIAKFPSPASENRAVAQLYNMYGREVHFYQQIAEAIRLRTPACQYAEFDPGSNDFVLLIEDLQGLRIGDQVAGCTRQEALAVIDAIAELHSSGWGDAAPAVISHNNPMQRDGMIAGFQAGWPVVLKHFRDLIPEAALPVGERMPSLVAPLLERLCAEPTCLAHADVRLDNIFFGQDEIALVDWQSVCVSAPEQDLAYFVTQSIPPKVRAEEDWLAHYHAALTGRGIDYPIERCRERFVVASLYLMCYAVVIAGTLDLGNERGQALGRTLLGNAMSALDEMGAFAFASSVA